VLSAPTRARVASVHDGDTICVDVPLGTKALLGVDLWAHDIPVRLTGCNARELKDPGGVEARNNLREVLPVGRQVTVVLGPDKYGQRREGTVTLPDGRDLVALLVATNWAATWDGHGARPVPPWPRPEAVT
jgi:endonuclease YncB( thermonuclease family)